MDDQKNTGADLFNHLADLASDSAVLAVGNFTAGNGITSEAEVRAAVREYFELNSDFGNTDPVELMLGILAVARRCVTG